MKLVIRTFGAAFAATALSACGGGGAEVASISPAPIAPAPVTPPTIPPPPPTVPPVPSGPIGLQASGSFKTYNAQLDPPATLVAAVDVVQFSYSAAANKYTITLPGYQTGQLVTTGAGGSFKDGQWLEILGTINDVTNGASSSTQAVKVTLIWPAASDLKYTQRGQWFDLSNTDWKQVGAFAYGIPTIAGDVPKVGSAIYSGTISGLTSTSLEVWGGVSLNFDFAAGTLSGKMTPEFAPVWDAVPLGTYVFRDTVFSPGSTSFSGAFQVSGSTAPSAFNGSFNGPQASELMASWKAPFINPLDGQSGSMAGIWTAKRP